MTDIALVTTTIHVPSLLRGVRDIGSDVEMFVAGDMKTPAADVEELCRDIGAYYLSPEEQWEAWPELSEIIGWNSIQRRNFAILAAVNSGADIIYTWDDDNMPRRDVFEVMRHALTDKRHATITANDSGWVNPGSYAVPMYWKRGYPYSLRAFDRPFSRKTTLSSSIPIDIGIVENFILGDPDVNATTRIEKPVEVEAHYQTLATSPKMSWAPLNTQSTAYRRELAPLLFVLPGVGRYDDIWAGYIAQRVMMETEYHILFAGETHQERNPHDLTKDLEQEIFGMRYTEEFCEILKSIPLKRGGSVAENLAILCVQIAHWFTHHELHQTAAFLRRWPDEVAKII